MGNVQEEFGIVPQDASTATAPAPEGAGALAEPERPSRARWLHLLSFRHISAFYIFVVIFIVFSIWVPDTFLSSSTWRSLLDTQALTALVAVGLVVPVAAGAFDLAVGTEVGLGAVLVAWLMASQDVAIVPAIVLTVLAGGLIGLVAGTLITLVRIDSFIATLGVSSVLLAMISWVSGDQQILNLSSSFQQIGTAKWLGITVPVWIMLAVALVVWYGLERTPLGRKVYATGGNLEAARLAGVRTPRVIVASLAVCGMVAGLGGILTSAKLGTGDPTIGPPYLLPAFTAVFLGSTQFRDGRFNVWGTVVAVYVLAAGVKGLQLAGAPTWIPDLFNGLALLVAVALAQLRSTPGRPHPLLRLLRLRKAAPQP
jgi:ribose transport system permease protein